MIGKWGPMAIVAACCVTACGGSTPVAPDTTFPLAGTWAGALTDDGLGAGTVSLVLSQTAAGVSGTFAVTSVVPALVQSGTVGGTAGGSNVLLYLTPGTPLVCSPALTLTGTLGAALTLSNGRMTGRYFAPACSGQRAGSLDLRRQ
jgi:hypothetical protein